MLFVNNNLKTKIMKTPQEIANIINEIHLIKVKPDYINNFKKNNRSIDIKALTLSYINNNELIILYFKNTINRITNEFKIDFYSEIEKIDFINLITTVFDLTLITGKYYNFYVEVIQNIDDYEYYLQICFVDNKNLKH